MQRHRPLLAVMENVDNFDDANTHECQSNLNQAPDMLGDIGYATLVLKLNSSNFGMPQDRSRLYIGCVALELYGYDVNKALSSTKIMADTVRAMQIHQPLEYDDILLDDDDELVMLELQAWQTLRSTDSVAHGKDTSWQERHQEEFRKHGLRWGFDDVPADMKASPWYKVLLPREQDIVIFTMRTDAAALSVDVSQSIGRSRVSTNAKMSGTVTPAEKRFFIKRKRLRIAAESFALQAIPWKDLDMTCEPPTLHSLAGNAWTGTVAMAVFFGMIAHLPWPAGGLKCVEVSDDEDDDV
jgi:site-specific DNA-cytosine methylase